MSTFAKIAEVKAGTVLVADAGFTCLKPFSQHVVQEDDNGLYVTCYGPDRPHDHPEGACDRHYLDGQKDGDRYTGLWLDEVPEEFRHLMEAPA